MIIEATNAHDIGVDEVDSYEELCHFITTVAERSSVRHFIMHARKCLLSGLSPAQNRTVPPLRCGSCQDGILTESASLHIKSSSTGDLPGA